MRKLFYLVIIITGSFAACSHSPRKPAIIINAAKSKPGDFSSFFKKFKADSVYQVAHIKFPLRKSTTNEEGNGRTVDYIPKDKWRYTSFKSQKDQIFNTAEVNKTKASVQYTVRDTGIFIKFNFLFKEGEWQLIGLTDESD